jgi:hypothetical protein
MSERLDAFAAQVDGWLLQRGLAGDVSPDGFWLARFGSTVVMLSLFEDEGRLHLRFCSVLVSGAQTSLDLVLRLLRLNNEVLFGAFQVFDDQTLAFTHTVVAEGLSEAAFHATLLYVARVADDHDEELQALAGGQRAEDVLEVARARA